MLKPQPSKTPLLTFVVALLLSALFYVITLSRFFQRVIAYQDRQDLKHGALVLNAAVHDFYFLGLILILPLIYGCKLVLEKIVGDVVFSKPVQYLILILWTVIIGVLLALSHFIFLVPDSASIFYTPLIVFIFIAYIAICLIDLSKWGKVLLYGLIGAVFLLALYHIIENEFVPFRSGDLSGIEGPWTAINFNAVFYSVVQAFMGKLDLIDYYAQYGNYSIILNAFFAIIPLSLTSYSAAMTALTILVYMFMFLALRRLQIRPAIAAATLMACYFFTSQNLAFQYWAILPVRMIFPAAVFFLIACFNSSGERKTYYSIFAVCAISILWNIDTGAVLLAAWLLTRAYFYLYTMPVRLAVKETAKDLALAITLVTGLLCIYAAYTYAVRGVLPHYENLLLYQTMYFGKGRGSAPFGLFDGWILVVLIYVAGLVHGICGQEGARDTKDIGNNSIVIFLSFFGLGIFSYYVMRSVPTNIFLVMWPAIVLMALAAESFTRQRRLMAASAAAMPLAYWAVLTAGLLVVTPVSKIAATDYVTALDVQRGWVRSLNLQQKNVIILSDNSGIFYLDSHANCPVPVPGITELISPKFIDLIQKYVTSEPGFVILDDSKVWYPELSLVGLQLAVKSLPIAAKSPDGNLTLYLTGK